MQEKVSYRNLQKIAGLAYALLLQHKRPAGFRLAVTDARWRRGERLEVQLASSSLLLRLETTPMDSHRSARSANFSLLSLGTVSQLECVTHDED